MGDLEDKIINKVLEISDSREENVIKKEYDEVIIEVVKDLADKRTLFSMDVTIEDRRLFYLSASRENLNIYRNNMKKANIQTTDIQISNIEQYTFEDKENDIKRIDSKIKNVRKVDSEVEGAGQVSKPVMIEKTTEVTPEVTTEVTPEVMPEYLDTITKASRSEIVTLCTRGNDSIIMMGITDKSINNISYELYMKTEEVIYMAKKPLGVIRRDKLLMTPTDNFFNVILSCNADFTVEDVARANEVAQNYAKNRNGMCEITETVNIEEAYKRVIEKAVGRANFEKNMKEEDKNFLFVTNKNAIAIRSSKMQELLDDLDLGYSRNEFWKAVLKLEHLLGVKLIEMPNGRAGATINLTHNFKAYVFRILQRDDALKIGGEVA